MMPAIPSGNYGSGVSAVPGSAVMPRAVVPRPTSAVLPLTPSDRALLAKHGRRGLLRRVRVRATWAWSATLSSLFVGLPMAMSSDLGISDAGLMLSMASLPAMTIAAHQQARLARIRANDPDNPRPLPASNTTTGTCSELADIDVLRDRLLGLLPALEDRYPEVAQEIRKADAVSLPALRQQGEALAALDGVKVANSTHSQQARAEIASRLRAGVAEYHQLLADSVLLLARSDATRTDQASLARARDLVASYNEGLRVASGLEPDHS